MGFALALYAAFVAALTVAEYRGDKRAQYLLKPACALGFILIALMSGALESLYGQIILAGLCFCAVGDVALLSRTSMKLFLFGMIAFALGHIAYIFAFTHHGFNFTGKFDVKYSFFAAAFSLLASIPIISLINGPMKGPACIYAGIIALVILFAISTGHLMIIIAAFLFAISDYFVGRDRFIIQKPWHAFAITPLYFGAQALFALSVAQAL